MSRPRRFRAARRDDWVSSSSSLGGVRDKHRGVGFRPRRCRLTQLEIDALYESNPIAARVVDKIVDDALSTTWHLKSIKGPDAAQVAEDVVRSDLEELRFSSTVAQAWKWARKDGGGLLSIGVFDQQELSTPLTMGAVLVSLNAVPAERAIPREQDVALNSPTYGRVLCYQVQELDRGAVMMHHSRCIPLEPIHLPIEVLQRRSRIHSGWGPSILERIYDDLARDGAASSFVTSMLYVASILYVKLTNYRQEHGSAEGAAKVRTMLAAMRDGLDSLGMLGLDKNDDIGNLSLTIAGAPDVLDRNRDRLAGAVDGMPREILFNESPTGLRGGELSGARAIYNSTVQAWRLLELRPILDRVLEIYFASKGLRIESWEVEWEPLYTPDAITLADISSKNAVTDASNIEQGVYSADEVRTQRCEQGNLGPIAVKPADKPEALALDPADVAAAQAAAAAPAGGEASVQDLALNGAQGASLSATVKDYNLQLVSYNQAVGILTLMFPGKSIAAALGPPPADPNYVAAPAPIAGAQAPATAPTPGVAAPEPSTDAIPADVVSVQAAAKAFAVSTRTITRMIEKQLIQYWGLGSHKSVSMAEVRKAAEAHREVVEPDADGDGEADDATTEGG